MCSRPNSSFISGNPETNGFNKQTKSICLFGFRNTPAAPPPPARRAWPLEREERCKKTDKKVDEIDSRLMKWGIIEMQTDCLPGYCQNHKGTFFSKSSNNVLELSRIILQFWNNKIFYYLSLRQLIGNGYRFHFPWHLRKPSDQTRVSLASQIQKTQFTCMHCVFMLLWVKLIHTSSRLRRVSMACVCALITGLTPCGANRSLIEAGIPISQRCPSL